MATARVVQMRPDGSWEVGGSLGASEQQQLATLVNQLIESKVLDAAQKYCYGDKTKTNKFECTPILLMPLNPTDQNPKENLETQPATKLTEVKGNAKTNKPKAQDASEKKKKPFVLQRLTNFDLMSQW